MKLLALILLLSAFSSLTLMEVAPNLKNFIHNCGKFFMKKPGKGNGPVTPTIFKGHQYKMICQRWNNEYRFATVYNTEKRIPIYSAYTFTGQEQFQRPENVDWKIEPQLENIKGYKDKKNMIVSPREENIIRNIKNQAVQLDYSGTRYSIGHVFPSLFAADEDHAVSTFALTNTAPQLQVDNERWAEEVEQPMQREINTNCRPDQNHLAYIVTGVVPGDTMMNIQRGDEDEQITVPSHFWSAYCCKNNAGAFISGTYITEQGKNVQRLTMVRLNEELTGLYHQDFSVFPGLNC